MIFMPFKSQTKLWSSELSVAQDIYTEVRKDCGFKESAGSWVTPPAGSHKFSHTLFPTYGWSGLPNTLSTRMAKDLGLLNKYPSLRGLNTCGNNSTECTKLCINLSGSGVYPAVQKSRLARTIVFAEFFEASLYLTMNAIDKMLKKHTDVAYRPDVFTDTRWEDKYPELFNMYPTVNFYGYTKHWDRVPNPAPNYSLTFSADERRSLSEIRNKVSQGHNVAVVVDIKSKTPKPDIWAGMNAVDGDDPIRGDSRFLDAKGVVVLLSPKGKARHLKHRNSKFIWPVNPELNGRG